jgi:hypothetical protein
MLFLNLSTPEHAGVGCSTFLLFRRGCQDIKGPIPSVFLDKILKNVDKSRKAVDQKQAFSHYFFVRILQKASAHVCNLMRGMSPKLGVLVVRNEQVDPGYSRKPEVEG